MLKGKHLPCPTHTALDFVGNEKDSVLPRDSLQTWKELRRWNDITTFTLNGFNDDRGNFFRVHCRLEDDVLQIVVVAIRNVSDTRN
jgi:hypothetical protein